MRNHRQNRSTILIMVIGLLPAALSLGLLGWLPAQNGGVAVNYLTHFMGNARLGWNANETVLTPDSIRGGGLQRLWLAPQASINGQVYAAPLYYNVDGQELLFVVTEKNWIYALDATNGDIIYGHVVGEPEGRPERSLTQPEFEAKAGGCGDINPDHGITSTPVIDPATNTLYLVNLTIDQGFQAYKVHAIDILTGREVTDPPGWPVTIRGRYRGVDFQAFTATQRGALTLQPNGMLYIPFSSRCDAYSWYGWIMGVDTNNPAAGVPFAFNTAPDGNGAGIWGQGGLSVDPDGMGYVVTGNGTVNFSSGGHSFAMSVLRLCIDPGKCSQPFSESRNDFFTISDFGPANNRDTDLGGSSALIIPEQGPETVTPRLLFTAGKDGRVYLVNRDNLGGLSGELQRMRVVGDGLRTAPSYFDGGKDGRFVYASGVGLGHHTDWEDGTTINIAPSGRTERSALGSGPAMIEFRNQLFVAWANNEAFSDSRELRIKASPDGSNWSMDSRPIGGNAAARTSPSLAVFSTNGVERLYVAWVDNKSHQIMVKSSPDGLDWSAPAQTLDAVAENEGYYTYASLAAYQGQLYLAFFPSGGNGQIVLKSTSDGQFGADQTVLYDPSPGVIPTSAPFLIPFNDKLYAFWLSNRDARSILFKSSADGKSWPDPPTPFNESANQHSGLGGLVMDRSIVEGPDAGPPRLHIFFISNNLNRSVLVKSIGTNGVVETGNLNTYERTAGPSPAGAVAFRGKPRFIFVANSPNRNLLLKTGDVAYPGKGLSAFRLTMDPVTQQSRFYPAWTSPTTYDYLPGPAFVTSNGASNGIVWVTEGLSSGFLHAYDAVTGEELMPVTERLPIGGRKFENTVVVNGRVYTAANGVVAYGLR